MKIIEGFPLAKSVLERPVPTLDYPVSPALRQALKRMFGVEEPEAAVRQIVGEVQRRGDAAIRDLTLRIDRIELASLEVGKDEIKAARRQVGRELLAALKLAADNIRDFHAAQKECFCRQVAKDGLGQMIRPLQRIGAYVPGGTAAYPSTVLMTAVPARVAGVSEIVLVTPPGANGAIPPITLAAADIAGVDRVFRVGGAQAIAALAYGTESIPRVDKICGPGNIFVVLAKKMVYGAVAIDGLQGRASVLIIADETARPADCAADLLAQAEHDALATAILVTTSRRFADAVQEEAARQLEGLSRHTIAADSLERAVIAVVESLDEAITLANLYAPEHLLLMFEGAADFVEKVVNAGCVVVGREGTVVLGDYVAGPSHVLPTGGTARFSSPLNVADFLKFINVIDADKVNLKRLAKAASVIARAEGLDAHARAAERRAK